MSLLLYGLIVLQILMGLILHGMYSRVYPDLADDVILEKIKADIFH